MSVKHTYLVEPGLWTVEGIYLDKEDRPHRQTGEQAIVHGPSLWTIDSRVNITGEDTRDFDSRYDISPLEEGKSYTEWKSITGGPEAIFGLFVLVEDTVMMPWESESGVYWGQEVLARVSPDEYLSRGYAFIKREKVSAWAVKLTRAG
ncbi:MAG: hypothetical protein LBF58_12045 [Deltaproteobacteria bacterium]|nr:hypothetical protein [Deltaproteobacteria bacterium]